MSRLSAICLAALLAVISCSRENPEPVIPDPAPVDMTLSADSAEADQAGGALTLTVTSPVRPKVSSVPGWIVFKDGTFDNYRIQFAFSVSGNNSRTSRTAAIKLTAEGLEPRYFTISQPGLPDTPPPGPVEETPEWETAVSAVRNMGAGWNLGNTLDSNSGDCNHMWIEAWTGRTVKDYETAWGQPLTTKALIHMFKQAGFGAIRIPVTWYPHMGTITLHDSEKWDPSSGWSGSDVDPAWMARVKTIVDYVLDEGLYCILNVHHDTGAADTAWLVASDAGFEAAKQRYQSLWGQIANTFKDYG